MSGNMLCGEIYTKLGARILYSDKKKWEKIERIIQRMEVLIILHCVY
jgi:hypothetical protein